MIQAHDGSWWLVCLGFRTQSGQHHVLGRETFLAPVCWNKNGWPEVNGNGTVSLDMKNTKTLPQVKLKDTSDQNFNGSRLGVEWNWTGNPIKENYSLTERKGFLRIRGSANKLDDFNCSPSFIGRRQEDIDFQATTKMQKEGNGNAGITAYLCPSAHYDLLISGNKLKIRYRMGMLLHEKEICKIPEGTVHLRIEANADVYTFLYSPDGIHYTEAGQMDTRYLSSETNGGFTGLYLGLFAEGKGHADFDWFEYMPLCQ